MGLGTVPAETQQQPREGERERRGGGVMGGQGWDWWDTGGTWNWWGSLAGADNGMGSKKDDEEDEGTKEDIDLSDYEIVGNFGGESKKMRFSLQEPEPGSNYFQMQPCIVSSGTNSLIIQTIKAVKGPGSIK